MKKYLVLFFLLLAGVVFAQSAEELYEGAVNKYFLGDNAGAVVLLRRVLADQPDNDKARVLLQQIESEGAAPVVATPTTVKRVVATTLRRAAATTTTLPKEKTKEEIKKEVEESLGVKVDKIRTFIRGNKKIIYAKLNKNNLAIDVATKIGVI